MYGDNAPGATWQETFVRAYLGPNVNFVAPLPQYFSQGNGLSERTIGGPKKKHGGGKGNPPPKKP